MATKKLKEEQAKALDEAKASAEETGTGNPALAPETSTVPEPGTTGDLDVLNMDEAHGLNPNITLSGTKSDGQGGQVLLDSVDPSVANAALIPDTAPPEPKNPSKPVEQGPPKPAEGEVLFECTADNRPFYSGGPMTAGERYVMSKEEGDVLVSLSAGKIVGTAAPASDSNAATEGE